LIHHPNPILVFIGELGFMLGVGVLGSGLSGANVELMPETRYEVL